MTEVFHDFPQSLRATQGVVFISYKIVNIATRYGLDGPEIESLWGRNFPCPSRTAPTPTQPPTQWVQRISRE